MNKKLTSLLLASAVGCTALQAEDYIIVTEVKFASEYLFRGVKEAGPTIMPSVEIQSDGAAAGDLYLGGWASTPARGTGAEAAMVDGVPAFPSENEVNVYAGFDAELQHGLFVDLGAVYYHFPQQGTRDDTVEPYLGLRYEQIADSLFTAGTYFYYDIDKSFTIEGLLEYSMPFGGEVPATLDLGGFGGYVDEDRLFEENHLYYGLYAEIPYRLSEVATFTAGLRYEGRANLEVSDDFEEERDFLFWTAAFTMAF